MFDWLARAPAPASALPANPDSRVGLVIGLGNPGREYQRTRHNVGFLVLDQLAARHGFSLGRKFRRAITGCWNSPAGPIVAAKPQTFMNASGDSAALIAGFYHLTPSQVLVVCDDVSLPFGRLRIRPHGSEGGHNGLKSLTKRLGTREYPRLRVGIGAPPGQQPMVSYVLEAFSAGEWEELPAVIDRAVDAIECIAGDGVQAAMNRFNGL